jgi:hypothetical protein
LVIQVLSQASTKTISLSSPQLSVVAVSRNDDHGGDLRGRMQHFVNGFIAQSRKHHLNSELVLVEWNPPPGRPSLEHAIEWPEDFGPATVRIVTVPPDVHAQLPHADALPLFQMIGKNVGIRRARGRYVLATNIDILLDDATVLYLRDKLKSGIMLRADRYDVPADLVKSKDFDQVLADCRSRFFQVNTRFGIFDVQRRSFVGMRNSFEARLLSLYNGIRIFGFSDFAYRSAKELCLGLAAMPRTLGCLLSGTTVFRVIFKDAPKAVAGAIQIILRLAWNAPGFLIRNAHKIQPLRTMPSRGYWYVRRALRRARAVVAPKLPRPLHHLLRAIRWPLRKIVHFRSSVVSLQRSLAKAGRQIIPSNFFRWKSDEERRFARSHQLHTWACGDFTLATREDWFRLRGYPEWPMYSWHVDSALMFAANAHDIRQTVLGSDYRIFHIDHSVGSGWSPEGEVQLFDRLKARGVPFLTNDDLRDWQRRAAKNPSSVVINPAVWGFAWVNLPERVILPQKPMNVILAAHTAAVIAES